MSQNVNNIFKVANGSKDRPVILMVGYVGGYRVNSNDLYKAIHQMEEKGITDCDMLINSGGGSTIDGFTIGEFIQNSSIKFHGIVVGMAASMAGVILQYCDTRKIYKTSRLMVHKVTGYVGGNADQIRSYADLVEQEEEKIIDKFISRTGKDKKTVLSWMKPGIDLWLNADKAKSNGLIDQIISSDKKAPKISENATPQEMISNFDQHFNAVAASYVPNIEKPKTNMKTIITALALAGLGSTLTENSSEEAVTNVLTDLIDKAKKVDTLKNELDAFKLSNAKSMIQIAQKEGKIPANETEDWIKEATEKPDLVAKMISRMPGKADPNSGLQRQTTDPTDEDTPEILKGREKWTFAEWQEKDSKGLGELQEKHTEAFNNLFNAQYSK